jgi:hypothetical protein
MLGGEVTSERICEALLGVVSSRADSDSELTFNPLPQTTGNWSDTDVYFRARSALLLDAYKAFQLCWRCWLPLANARDDLP